MAAFGRMEAACGGWNRMMAGWKPALQKEGYPPTEDTVRLFSWGAGFQPARARGKRLVS